MPPLSGALLASALAAAPLLPVGAPVVYRPPDVAAELREFTPSPPEWSADVVNALYGEWAVAVEERKSGWLSDPGRWELVDYVDRAHNYATHGWLARRGIAADHYGYNEFQETLALDPDGALALLGERGLARGPFGELVFDPNAKAGFIADPLEPRWAAMLAYDQSPSPLLGDALSQDNLAGPSWRMGPSAVGHFGDASVRGFAAWRAAHGEPPVPDLRAYVREHAGAQLAKLPPYAPVASQDASSARTAAFCDDPVLADHKLFLSAANLQVFTRLYTDLRQIAARAGRAYDVHGNLGAGMMGTDAYAVALGMAVDTPWGEGWSLASSDVFQQGWYVGWPTLRLAMTVAVARGERAVQFLINPANQRTPELLAQELAEDSAGGVVPLLNPDSLARDAPQSVAAYDAHLRFRDAHRALYLPGGRTRWADVGLLYSVATALFDPCLPEAADTPPINDLAGAARALENVHVPYEAVVLPHPALEVGPPRAPDLARYRLLVAPSLERLSNADLARLAAFLRGGGTLAVLGKLGVRDENNRPRARDALAELRAAGDVRVLIGGASLFPHRGRLSPDGRALAGRLESELRALGRDPVVDGDLPATTFVKTWRHAGGIASAHFVNYAFDGARGVARPTAPARVRLRLPEGVRADVARWLVPGEPEVALRLRRPGDGAAPGAVEVTIPGFRVYGVLVFGPEARASALARGDRRLARARMAGAGAAGLDARVAKVQSLRASDPQAYDGAASALLRALSAEREAAYLAWIRSLADWHDPVAAFAFGARADAAPWRAVGAATDYLPQLGYGWLPADDDTRPSPEERIYRIAEAADPDALAENPLAAAYWPYPQAALPAAVANSISSGRPRRFRVDLPDGDYEVSVVSANGSYPLAGLLVSGMVSANGRPALLDVPLGKGALVRRSFTTRVEGGALELGFGGATGFGVAAVRIDEAKSLAPDPLEAGGIRSWRVSERHPNPDWAPLRDLDVPAAQSGVELLAPGAGIPLVDLGTLAHAEIGDVVTATAEVERASAGPAELSVGASSAARVYLNGKLVLELANQRGVERDEGLARVRLAAGTNRLEVVLERFWERRWLFYASLH